MSERENLPKRKQGVSGWRAFLMMFGCGTMAAFLVVGVVVGGVRMLFLPSDEEKASPQNKASREPVTDMTPGAIDACELIEDYPPISLTHKIGEESSPDEKNPKGNKWTVSDKCKWEFSGKDGHNWILAFSYKSIINYGRKKERYNLAEEYFNKKSNDELDNFEEVTLEGRSSDNFGKDHEIFGVEKDLQKYVLINKIKSSVYVLHISQKKGNNSSENRSLAKEDFDGYAESVSDVVDSQFEDVVPD